MRRDPTLHPLSRQHQHGLALTVVIDRNLRGDPSPELTAGLARKVADAYELELKNHFDIEERILFPAIRRELGPTPLVEELEADHRRLEGLIARLSQASQTERPEALREFAAALSAHIRREERELFEDIQKRLPRGTLDQLGRDIDEAVVRVCL